jgi:hypothetical protein
MISMIAAGKCSSSSAIGRTASGGACCSSSCGPLSRPPRASRRSSLTQRPQHDSPQLYLHPPAGLQPCSRKERYRLRRRRAGGGQPPPAYLRISAGCTSAAAYQGAADSVCEAVRSSGFLAARRSSAMSGEKISKETHARFPWTIPAHGEPGQKFTIKTPVGERRVTVPDGGCSDSE